MTDEIKKQVLKPEQIQKVFLSYKVQVERYEKDLTSLVINNDLDESSALMVYGKGKELLEKVTEIKKDFENPFAVALTDIRSYFTKFITPLSKSLEVGGNIILTYKSQKAESLKAAEEEKMKTLNDEFDLNFQKFETLKRIASNSIARIFGGIGKIKGIDTLFEMPSTVEECDSLKYSFENNFPSADNFGKFGPNSIMIKEYCLQKLNELRTMIANGKEIDNQFHKNLLSNKLESELEAEEKRLIKQKGADEKAVIKITASAFSNTRKTIKFEVMDISQIPLNYLMVNKKAVDDYEVVHREEIKAKLKDADTYEPIKGIKFYFEKKVTR